MKKKIIICCCCLIILVGILALVFTKKDKYVEIYMPIEIEYEEGKDYDKDGLSNIEEKKLKTSVYSLDTDGDGLTDYDEVKTYNTNPLKVDTDGDGLDDYNEIMLKFDPNKKDTDGNGIIDSKEKASYSFDNGIYEVNVTGTGNIANTYLYIEKDTVATKKSEKVIEQITASSRGKVESLKARVYITEDDLARIGSKRDDLQWGIIQVASLNKKDYSDWDYVESNINPNNLSFYFDCNELDRVYIIADAKYIEYDKGVKQETKLPSVAAKVDNSKKIVQVPVADNNFKPEVNGFSFYNYMSDRSPVGNCYGMALFADLYYAKKLPLKNNRLESSNTIDYNLTYVDHFKKYKNLFDYKLGSYAKKLNDKDVILEVADMQKNTKFEKSDVQLFNSIGQLQFMQKNIRLVSSATDSKNNGLKTFDILVNRIKNGEAPLFKYVSAKNANHAVNAIAIVRTGDNVYKLYYYDNNKMGKALSMEIKCGATGCLTTKSDRTANAPFEIARTIDDELVYFK